MVLLAQQEAEMAGGTGWAAWAWLLGTAVLATAIGLGAHAMLMSLLGRLAERTGSVVLGSIRTRLRGPSRVAIPLLALQFVAGAAVVPSGALVAIRQALAVALIATVAWGVMRVIGVVEDVILARHRIDVADNRTARRIHTQVRVLGRTLQILVGIVGLAVALMTFPQVRQVGMSLLASAGIAGLVAGVAARPVLENLIAGVQMAFTEPIAIDDVLVIEGQWGRVEEITPTYVVVKIWDDRRLVVPLTHFITKPIENWTRQTSQILGTAFFYMDYTVPVEAVRAELKRILDGSRWWDRRGWALQVTDMTERCMQVRALMSAADGPTAFELRCEVREKLIEFINREYPGALPRVRSDAPGPVSEAA